MKFDTLRAVWPLALAFGANCLAQDDNRTDPRLSRQVLPQNFKPPQVFRNVNLVRTINLEKNYVRESVNVIVENIDKKAQDEYYLPLDTSKASTIGALDVRDKKEPEKPAFEADVVEYDTYSPTQFLRIRLPQPLKTSAQLTLAIKYVTLASLNPLPATIEQQDKQYVQYKFSAYMPSAYTTLKQKTKLQLPNSDVPDYTTIPGTNSENKEDPVRSGSSLTYGPFGEVPSGAEESASVRYEFTKPLNHVSLLERDIEVSHWGGNLATEERYWFENRAAGLKKQFSRLAYQSQQYYNPPSAALRQLNIPLPIGSGNAYVIDDIGNVSTSHFRSTPKLAKLEVKPRYPVFGNWKYKFKIGWDQDLKSALRKRGDGSGYVLRVPFLLGPHQSEGVAYERVHVRVVLPEGATNVKFDTTVPLIASKTGLYHTFMDTKGRTSLELTAINIVDDLRDEALLINYEYPAFAGLRKPLTILAATFSVFVAAWALGQVDTSIGKR